MFWIVLSTVFFLVHCEPLQVITSEEDSFECPKNLNRIPGDTTCREYYSCTAINGSIIIKYYSCPFGRYFNTEKQRCVYGFTSSCSFLKDKNESSATVSPRRRRSLSKTESGNSNSYTSTDGDLSASYGSIRSSSGWSNSSSGDKEANYSNASIRDSPHNSSPEERIKSSTKSLTTSQTSLSSNASYADKNLTEKFQCSSVGRFSNIEDKTCRTFFMCLQLENKTFFKWTYHCPNDTVFNSENGLCVDPRLSPCVITSTTSKSQTTSMTPTQCVFEEDPNYFQCNSTGRFNNYSDLNCQTFFVCVRSQNGTFTTSRYSCPETSYFNPAIGDCDMSYTCPCNSGVTSFTASYGSEFLKFERAVDTRNNIRSCITTVDRCSTEGWFPNNSDQSCRSYYLCSYLKNNTFIKTRFSCPINSIFNPYYRLCVTSYVCPCSAERSFSILRIIKTWLRATMTEDRLIGLALLYIHRNIKINVENIIDRYAKTRSHRLDFNL